MSRIVRTLALVVLPLGLSAAVVAQDKDKSKKSGHERLQPYWTQLELSEKQRDAYDRVVREYGPRIDKLEAELDALKEKRRKDWHAILTPAQKSKLESLLASRGKNKSKSDDDKDGDDEMPKKKAKKSEDKESEDEKPTTKKKTTKKDKG